MLGIAAASLIRSQAWGGWEPPFYSASLMFFLKESQGPCWRVFFFFFPPLLSLQETCDKAQSLKLVKLKLSAKCSNVSECAHSFKEGLCYLSRKPDNRQNPPRNWNDQRVCKRNTCWRQQTDLENKVCFYQGHRAVNTSPDSKCVNWGWQVSVLIQAAFDHWSFRGGDFCWWMQNIK